jgi:hypothetical protein
MTLPNAIIDGMSAIACLSADGLARAAEPITKGMVALALANLRKTISTSAKGRGVTHASTSDFLPSHHGCLSSAPPGPHQKDRPMTYVSSSTVPPEKLATAPNWLRNHWYVAPQHFTRTLRHQFGLRVVDAAKAYAAAERMLKAGEGANGQ